MTQLGYLITDPITQAESPIPKDQIAKITGKVLLDRGTRSEPVLAGTRKPFDGQRVSNPGHLYSGAATGLTIAVGPDEQFDQITHEVPSPNVEVWGIKQPNVKRHMTEYSGITFREGDRVTIKAAGCVQTGGAGKTWKRYVNPQGPNSDRLYHGLIWIPGATGQLVRISSVIDRPLRVSGGDISAKLFLRLGYEDDDYSDNGYWGHDDGTGNQCKGVGSAWVTLRIEHTPR